VHYPGLALYAEGPTDYRFLSPVLRRLCEHLCLTGANSPVDVSDVLGLDHPKAFDGAPRKVRIVEAGRDAAGAWRVLFVHADGAGDARAARDQQVLPGLGLLSTELSDKEAGVGVVPVRETEAWALVDGDALRSAFGTALDDAEMNLPKSAADTESDKNPKKTLEEAFLATRPTGRRARRGASPLLGQIGENVRLERLRALDSFQAFENDLVDALRELDILRKGFGGRAR